MNIYKRTSCKSFSWILAICLVSGASFSAPKNQKEELSQIIKHREGEVEVINPGSPEEEIIMKDNVVFEVAWKESVISLEAQHVTYKRATGVAEAQTKVKINYEKAVLTSDKCVYFVKDRKAIFTGSPVYREEKTPGKVDEWRGDRLEVYFGDKGISRLIGKPGKGLIHLEKNQADSMIRSESSIAVSQTPVPDTSVESVETPKPLQEIDRELAPNE